LESQKRCEEESSRLLNQLGRQKKEHVVLDGKTLRGMLSHESELQIPVHLVALSEVKMGSVLAQRQGEEHHNE
jgi:hypothetical protein